jgi:acetyl esterase
VPDAGLRADPAVSPLFADLAGLPPALVVTAGHDPLRDEGDRFAERLRAAGVAVEHRCEPNLEHGFLQSTGEAESAAAARFFGSARALLHPAP